MIVILFFYGFQVHAQAHAQIRYMYPLPPPPESVATVLKWMRGSCCLVKTQSGDHGGRVYAPVHVQVHAQVQEHHEGGQQIVLGDG